MDNQYDNDYYNTNSQPQKPFTEKNGEPVPTDPEAAYRFEPQKPLMQQPQSEQEIPAQPAPVQNPEPQPAPVQNMPQQPFNAPPQPPQYAPAQPQYKAPVQPNMYQAPPQPPVRDSAPGYNPIEQTATYADNRFVDRQYPPQSPAQPNEARDFVPKRPDFYGYQQPQQPVKPQTTVQPQPEYQGYPDARPAYSRVETVRQPVYGSEFQSGTKPEKTKTNKGLVIVIIVLSVLLAASIGGMIFFTFDNNSGKSDSLSDNNSGKSDGPAINFTIPDNNGGGGSNMNPQTTEPAEEHKESDYSDKTDKNFKGIELKAQPADKDDKKYGSTYAYSKASDAAVGVECYQKEGGSVTSQGTGTVITSDGYIVTNSHVIGNSKTMYIIKIVDSKGKTYKAGVVGFDSRTDLALLKIDGAKDMTAVEFGDSEKLELGDDLIVIGNPGGTDFATSMTKGVVSALNRDASTKNLVKYIQTDAAINPGNSGGPAVNDYGQVIGIASAKIVDESYEGMGFCIPSSTVNSTIDSLMKNGYVTGRVKIGISGTAVTSALSQQYGLPKGIYAETVTKDGPCDKAGVKEGEIVTAFDGTDIASFSEIYNLLEGHKAGDKVKIKVYNSETQKTREVEITLQEDK